MINQRHCPFCKAAAHLNCSHLALAVEARDFVRRCVESSGGQGFWQTLSNRRRQHQLMNPGIAPESEDYTWLETAFCEKFLKHLHWFGGMDYEWRTGPKLEQGGFWVLLWSKEPRQLWWELRDELERRSSFTPFLPPQESSPWLLWLTPR